MKRIDTKVGKLCSFFTHFVLWVVLGVNMTMAAGTIIADTTIDDPTETDQCTLREAIQLANEGGLQVGDCQCPILIGDCDTVQLLENAIYNVEIIDDPIRRIALPPIEGTMTIVGQNATIQRDTNASENFGLIFIEETGRLFISDLTIKGNRAGNNAGAAIFNEGELDIVNSKCEDNRSDSKGGAIFNAEKIVDAVIIVNLSIADSMFIGNRAISGGALTNEGGLAINNSLFTDNQARSTILGGGAVLNDGQGTIAIHDSTFMGNMATSDGGAVLNDAPIQIVATATVEIENSTFSNNNSGRSGGAISAGTGFIKITNSTITNNTASVAGGGAYVEAIGRPPNRFSGKLEITHSTITDNVAQDVNGCGGGIKSLDGNLTLANNIIAFNSNSNDCNARNRDGDTNDCYVEIVGSPAMTINNGFNVFSSADPASCDPQGTDILGANTENVALGVLEDNGGPTFTRSIGEASVSAGLVPVCTLTTEDQREPPGQQQTAIVVLMNKVRQVLHLFFQKVT